jgi:hypothetical protein
MKWFVYIFSLYILVLSDIPCNAGDDCCKDEVAMTTTSNEQPSNSDHKHSSPCAPFLACGNYHGVTIPDNFIEFLKEVPQAIKLQHFYKEQPLPHFSTSIWQPPKTA